MTKSMTIHATKEIFVIDLAVFCAVNIFDMRIDIPIDASIIIEIAANNSNLTNEELK
jgi:hypothetical protein